jgi:glycosyltransferase involved in cell wall biosynthesis
MASMNMLKTTSGSSDEPRTGLRIAMALYGEMTYDSRVIREAETLSEAGHEVTIYCFGGEPSGGAPFRVVSCLPDVISVQPDGRSPFLQGSSSSPFSRVWRRIRWVIGYARALRAFGRLAVRSAGAVDVWHAHDLTGLLAIGPFVGNHSRIVYDSHELFLETGTAARLPGVLRRVLGMVERYLTRRAIALVTVNESYAEVLERRLTPRRTIIVRNCPPRWSPPDQRSPLRQASGVPDGVPLILYHGAFSENRGIEELAEALVCPGLEAAHLVLLGVGSTEAALNALAREPRFGGRVHVLAAVPPEVLLEWVAGADVDVMALQHSSLNHYLCTPNKLWESIATGVPVVVSDFPTMRRIVLDDPAGLLGGVCDPASPSSIAAAILAVVGRPGDERARLRKRCLQVAHQRWNWEAESARLVGLYADIEADTAAAA